MVMGVDLRALRRFVVRIDHTDGATVLGTGFFVAPGWVLTAAHVAAAFDQVAVLPDPSVAEAAVPANVVARSAAPPIGSALWPFPDLALLQLEEDLNHPCVLLAAADPVGDCCAWGYPEREYGVIPSGSPATFVYEGLEGDGYIRLKAGQAAPGISGAPLLCPAQGAVVGVVTGSRDVTTDLGGWASPVAALLAGGGPGVPADLAALGEQVGRDNRAAILADPLSWRNVLRAYPASHDVVAWAARLRDAGIYVWTDEDVRAGCAVAEDTSGVDHVEHGVAVEVGLLRRGRLPNLQEHFADLGEVFDRWLVAGRRKRETDGLRVLWLVGEAGPHRSMALLACLARAGMQGRVVYDAGQNLGRAAIAMDRPAALYMGTPVIGVDLRADQPEAPWADVRDAIVRARRQLPSAEIDPYPLFVVAGTTEQEQHAYDALEKLMEIDPVDTRGRQHQRPHSDAGTAEMVSPSLSREHVFNRGLPMTSRKLFGRARELKALHHAWTSDRTRIASVVAYGGTGKSALVNTWLREMRERDYEGAQKVYAWSFYSQGTKDNLVSADPFIRNALSWLGDDLSVKSLNPWAKGLQLASLIKKHRFLLVLDGMEPLQHPLKAPDVGGQLTDDSIRALLEELAKPDWDGLCVITTRVPLTDLDRFTDKGQEQTGTAVTWDLENLDDQAGAALLHQLIGGDPTFPELQQAVQEVEGHALAITLLGNYLRDVHGGNLAGRVDLEKLTVEVSEGGHARRIMASYGQWLERHGRLAELAVLRVIGLFDRPATPDAMNALLANASLGSAMAEFSHVGSDEWNRCIEALRGMGLLNKEIPNLPGVIDAHPLVREHFRDLLQTDGAAWLNGNRTLFEYYQRQAPQKPLDSEGMNLLYAAVTHGCAAELHHDVYKDVLLKRVWHDRRASFSTRRLGMTGSDLVALSNYFQHRRWRRLQELPIPSRARVLILTNAGVRLRQLGRLVEARECFGAVVQEINPQSTEPEEMEDASYGAAQYCELLVIAGKLISPEDGELDSALASGRKAIEYADRGSDPYFNMHARSSLAEVYFMLGQPQQAALLFEEAKVIEREREPRPPFLYSQSLFRYGYYLIEANQAEEIIADEASDPGWGTNGEDSSLLSKAIRLMILGAARRSLIERGDPGPELKIEAHRDLDNAVIMFRTAGYADYTVRGLLERAHFYRVRRQAEDYARAQEDLDRATIEADRGQMELLYTDILLQQVACYRDFREPMSSSLRSDLWPRIKIKLDEAAARVDKMGYFRRQTMLEELGNDLL